MVPHPLLKNSRDWSIVCRSRCRLFCRHMAAQWPIN
uniref:Uncharacterized protein n=1 Tax=Anguilla anguilla TaxID=7936 RepID=A0A0E9U344_ANGAN